MSLTSVLRQDLLVLVCAFHSICDHLLYGNPQCNTPTSPYLLTALIPPPGRAKASLESRVECKQEGKKVKRRKKEKERKEKEKERKKKEKRINHQSSMSCMGFAYSTYPIGCPTQSLLFNNPLHHHSNTMIHSRPPKSPSTTHTKTNSLNILIPPQYKESDEP